MWREIVPRDHAPSSPPLENANTIGFGQSTRITTSELAEFNGGENEKDQSVCSALWSLAITSLISGVTQNLCRSWILGVSSGAKFGVFVHSQVHH
jgi:hypothetical protein